MRVALFATTLTLLSLGAAAPARPTMHLRLTKSLPAKDSAYAAAPGEIRLWYSQEPELRLSRVTLTGPQGSVTLAPVRADTADATVLVARVTGAVPPGSYTVTWRTASSDGHAIRGEIPFKVRGTE